MVFQKQTFKVVLAGICSTLIAIGFGRFIYTPILPSMQGGLNLSSTVMGVISSYNYFGYLVGSMISVLIKFKNIRILVVISSLVSAITICLMGFSSDIKIFMALRFICGISSAFGFVYTISLMFEHFQNSDNKSLQLLHFCGIGIGIAIGTFSVWILSNSGFDWDFQWMIIGFLGILFCIPIIIYTPFQSDLSDNLNYKSKSKLEINFITISLGYFFFGIGYIIFGTFISAMVKFTSDILSYQYVAWIIVGFFAIPSVLFWSWVSKKVSQDYLLFTSCLTVALGISFFLFEMNLYILALSCLLYGLGVPGSVALVLVEGKKRFSGNINISVAILTAAFSIGQILGPYISGMLIDLEKNYHSSIILAVICLIISSILMLDVKRFKI